jgi:glycosyltransferase involved in cell wall biosynthesis
MKVAIVHDYIKEYGGAERVLEALCEIFPQAPVFTSVYLPSYLGPHEERFKKINIKTSWAQYLPFKAKLISPLRLLSPFIFKSFNFSGYDVVIVSQTGAYFPNSIKKKKARLITYCHTPPRYLYGYATAREWKKKAVFRFLGETANHFLRIIDYKSSQNVDYFIANSENIKKRIRKFYGKDAYVIYPPVLAPNSNPKSTKKNYYLAGGRLARPKHIDLIVETFALNGKRLKVFGKAFAGYGEELRQKAKENIEFLGEVSDEDKYKLMEEARAFIFASEDEDFGITPVEAEALGTAVIAYKSGGVIETVRENKTGIFFDTLATSSLEDAIEKFEKNKFDSEYIKKQALKFSDKMFRQEIKDFVERYA